MHQQAVKKQLNAKAKLRNRKEHTSKVLGGKAITAQWVFSQDKPRKVTEKMADMFKEELKDGKKATMGQWAKASYDGELSKSYISLS